ncbi:MAG: ferredoxin-like protein [Coriobacteriales bacterium]|nr:ferredoxin-like protein [Coriobacteriales bacterium]
MSENMKKDPPEEAVEVFALTEETSSKEAPDGGGGSSGALPKGAGKPVSRRTVLALAGCGIAGLVAGGALASWGITSTAIAAGRVMLRTTPQKLIVTDRAKCSGCQRCEMSCTIKNDKKTAQHIARVQVWRNYNYGHGVDTPDGIFGAIEYTIETCKQCAEPWCLNNCPVHAIYESPESGARMVDPTRCIGCGMCHAACPWNMPTIDPETGKSTKCISCGRCAQQCPNGAITFIDWADISTKVLETGTVSTASLIEHR